MALGEKLLRLYWKPLYFGTFRAYFGTLRFRFLWKSRVED